MDLVLVGSFGYDTISTQHGTVKDTLGGAAVHAGLAASRVLHQEGRVGLVSVVGEDVVTSDLDLLESRNLDLTGIETLAGQTFTLRFKHLSLNRWNLLLSSQSIQ